VPSDPRRVRLAVGDAERALADSRASVVEARAIRDPQAILPALGAHVFVLTRLDRTEEARRALSELADARLEAEGLFSGVWLVEAALAERELGLVADPNEAEDAGGHGTPWSAAALLVTRGDLAGAADALAELEAARLEADVRLAAARQFATEGRRAELAEQLGRALAFYRSVGAAASIREAEALLPAAS
jgi:hypothetical protein